jgi:DNA-directed RNA polymerase specialized sigma24 family protein
VLRDPDAADELSQEFAVRVLRGDFRRADPRRGRFRDLVKTAALHLVVDYYRRRKARPKPWLARSPELSVEPDAESADLDGPFVESWRHELINRAWATLALHQRRTNQPYYDILRLRVDHPELSSSQMAEVLSCQLDKLVAEGWVRQTLHRAREKFVDLILTEVRDSLENPSDEELEGELIDMGLLDFCRKGLKRCGRNPVP